MTQINLGNITTQNGVTTANGISSGLDTQSLITAILSSQQDSITTLSDTITTDNSKISALGDLRTKLSTFQTAADKLRNPPGVGNESDNYFAYRTVNVSAADGGTYVTATASPGANIGSYTISDVTLATAQILRRDGFTSKSSSVVGDISAANDYSISNDGTTDNSTLSLTDPVQFSNDVATAGTQATISIAFGAQNQFDAADSLTFGSEVLTFGGTGGNDLDISGAATLEQKLQVVVNKLNSYTSGTAADYTYEISGGNTIVATRNVNGTNTSVTTHLHIQSNFASGADTTQTVAIGDVAATNAASSGYVDTNGTDGTDDTAVSDALTVPTSTLSGAFSGLSATYNAGSDNGDGTFNPNTVTFSVTIGGETYTSNAVTLLNGSIDANGDTNGDGAGDNGFGNRIAAGTVITFVKDTQTGTGSQRDVTFQFTTGTSDITVNNATDANTLATNIQTFLTSNNVSVTDSTPAFRTGTFTLGGADITIDAGDTLTTIASKINAVTSTSGVIANVIQVSASSYSLQLKAATTGTANAISEFSGGYITFGNDSEAFTETQPAADATFTFEGISITRSTNTITDLLDNVSITLKSASGAVESTLDVAPDTTTAQNSIIDFLNAYNDLKTFAATQTQRDSSGALLDTAVLGDEAVLSDTLTSIDTQLNALVDGLSSGAKQTLFNLGISFEDFAGDSSNPPVHNIFTADTQQLSDNLAANFDEVRRIFEFDFNSSSPDLGVYTRTNDTTLTNFKLDIDTSRSVGDQVRVLDATTDALLFNADYSNGVITGQTDTSLQGLKLIYTGGGAETITVSLSQGTADKIYNVLDNVLTSDTGTLDLSVSDLQDKISTLQDREDKQQTELDNQRTQLQTKFANLEAAISKFNNVLSFIDAQRATNNANSY